MFNERRKINNTICLYYDLLDWEDADFLEPHIMQSVKLLQSTWGLEAPKECRVYIMDSWASFLFHSGPWYLNIIYLIFFPVLYFRINRVWNFCRGWTLLIRKRPAVGIKPLRLSKSTKNQRVGELIFVKEKDETIKLQNALCHELTHAYSVKLNLPMWLNEGIAMLTAEKYVGRQTVREDSLLLLKKLSTIKKTGSYRKLPRMNDETIAYHYVRGYWLTRLLAEKHPALLSALLEKRQRNRTIEKQIADAFGISRKKLWKHIIDRILTHFSEIMAGENQEAKIEK